MADEPNPYASPADAGRDEPLKSSGEAVLLRQRTLFRRVWLPPPVSAILEYNARGIGYDIVRVGGVTAVWRWAWAWFVPRFDFTLLANGERKPAVLTVRIGWSLKIERLTIEVDDEVVYEENA